MVAEQLGQGPEMPAIDSGTVRRTPQEEQENEITPGVIDRAAVWTTGSIEFLS